MSCTKIAKIVVFKQL